VYFDDWRCLLPTSVIVHQIGHVLGARQEREEEQVDGERKGKQRSVEEANVAFKRRGERR
jgi:hypothetical protein